MKNTQFIKGRRCKVLIAAELQKRSRAWCFGACAAVLLLVVAPKLCAQQITNIGVNEGLSSRYTFNALQDGKGFVWIATRFGIDRFDGRVARHYPIDILYKSNSPIRSVQLLLDKDSALWAFTNRGAMYKYAPQKDEFELVYYFSKYVKTACFTSTGNLFVSDRYEIGVVKNGRFTSTFNFADSNEEIKALKNYDSDNLMIATSANIYKFDIRTHKVTPILKNKLNSIESCYIDLEMQRLYIGSIVGNLYLYDMTKGILTNINDKRLQYMPILCINKIDENYIMAGTDGVGACLLNVNTLKIEDFFDDEENNALRIKGNAVYDIYNDRAGRIWLSTYSGGVNVINMQKMDFRTIEHRDNDANSLYGMSISDILEDSKGNLWFAANKGLSRYNVAQNKWTILLRNKNVLTLFQDLNGKIWAGTYSSGVFVFDLNGNLQKNLVADPANPRNSLGTNFVYSINQDSTGNIWVGGRKGSLSKYNAKNERLELLPVYQINYIVPKNKDEMLIATEQGVVTVDVASNAVRQCTFNKNLKSIFVTDIYVESDSILWLSTYGSGINRCNYYTGTVQSFSVNDGLPTSIVYAMLPDEHGNLWFSSEQGIGYFDVKKRNVQTYSKQDGISGTQYRSLSRLKDTQGNYYFGSYEGVTIFNPLNIQPQKPAGRLYFQDFFLFNQIVKPDIDGAKRTLPLHDALDNISEITLKYYQHSFSINFSAIDYANTQNRHFAWMLENLDKEWNSPSAETTANYTNIGTGRYVFRLRYLGDNNAVLDERALTITVAPPFWNTAWARILEIILTIALLTWVYLYTRRRIRKRQTQERIEIFLRMQTTSEFTRKATAIVEQNLTNTAFSVSDFSKEMGLSRSMLYSKFNSLTGYSPNDFIKEVRMKKAIDYFREKKHTINEIAYMVGFDEPAYFSTCFKKIYGKTPSQFILEMKSEYK